jgi:hypothetical protein
LIRCCLFGNGFRPLKRTLRERLMGWNQASVDAMCHVAWRMDGAKPQAIWAAGAAI